MKPCVFIIPYFGKFKNYFPLFLLTCKANPSFNWLIITDSEEKYAYPENVSVVRMAFSIFREVVNQAFPFEVSLDRPYKLCDYKPAYGYILKEYIRDYQYWGYCDCDLLLGNLEQLLLPLLSMDYDKIFAAGHMTLYKNTDENNSRFMGLDSKHGLLYQKAFTSEKIYAFDEMCYSVNVHTLFEELGANVFAKDIAFNASTTQFRFVRKYYDDKRHRWYEEHKKRNLMVWDGKRILEYYLDRTLGVKKREYLYLHLQSRQLALSQEEITDTGSVIITPIGFHSIQNIPMSSTDIVKLMALPITMERIVMGLKRIYHVVKPGVKTWQFNPYQVYNGEVK